VSHEAEVLYYKELFSSESNSIKRLWNNLNMVCSCKQKRTKLNIQKLVVNNLTVNETPDICNGLNSFFATIGEKLVDELVKENPNWNVDDHKKYLSKPVKHSVSCEPVTTYELSRVIADLKISKSPGPDEISLKLVKKIVAEISEPLLHIYNLSFLTGVVPNELRVAKVIPIFKKEDPSLQGNYRPILLPNIFDKLLEKLMHGQVSKYLTMNNLLYDYQFGFRKRHSTALALIEVVDNIYHNLDEGNRCCGVYLDLQKAYDTVNHELLLIKLYNCGIRGILHKWFRSYLTNRQQFTCVVGARSSGLTITCGVPQGSVLGPLLF